MPVQTRSFPMRALVVGLLTALFCVLAADAAYAHADLRSSDPADGAVLAAPPDAVTFTFSEDILAQGSAVTLTAVESGDRLPVAAPKVARDTVTVDWPVSSPAGELRAAFRVVSADGHPIEGSVTFTVDRAAGAPETAPVAERASPTAPVAASARATSPATSASPSPAGAEPTEGDARLALLFFLALAAAVVAGGYAGLWFMRRAR